MRRRLIVGNWKMHKTASEAAAFVRRLSELAPPTEGIEVVLAPPFTALHAVAQASSPSFPFMLAAQNLHWEDQGAFTGEVSAPMLTDLGCRYVILGHSERRRLFGEQDEGIHKKILAALHHGLRPILCLGESLTEREAGRTESIVTSQLLRCLEGVSKDDILRVAIAYEPIWAIGTGRAATPAQAATVHETLRHTLASGWGSETGGQVRILYGGSVTPENAGTFLASPQIDGSLVGGACLDPQSFATIITLAQKLTG
ncbi:MAG: triose-phosphate isomerase [Nitrospirae bacterium]|nr:triose-phosphate isomerase [Nitrospirota bacterium]